MNKFISKTQIYPMIVSLSAIILGLGIIEPIRIFFNTGSASAAGTFLFAMLTLVLLSWEKVLSTRVLISILMITSAVFGVLPNPELGYWKYVLVQNSLYIPFRWAGIGFGFLLWKVRFNWRIIIISLLWILCLWITFFGYQDFFYLMIPDAPRITYTPVITGI